MNCANHPDVAPAAYCQNCGKPLCTACVRSVGGVVYCEPCLAARLSPHASTPQPGVNYTGLHAHPLLAGLLGFIPGVGAMYNGQFVKALAHVLIFAVFVSLSDRSFFFGLLMAAWVFYQVFDAAQTAKARRDGLPLPNPFGLNDLGARLGMAPAAPYVPGFTAPPPAAAPDPAAAAASGLGAMPGAGEPAAGGWNPVPPPPGYPASYAVPPLNPNAPAGPPLLPERHRHPLGAVILIAIGVLLLLNTLGVFEMEWIGRAWPLALIAIGAWLLYRRTQENNPPGRSLMNSWLLLRRLRGPAFLILVGITALLNQWGILSFSRSWPLYLILAGIFGLVERALLSGAPPTPPYATAYPASVYPAVPGYSEVPAAPVDPQRRP